MIKVGIVDDHDVTRGVLEMLLNGLPKVTVVFTDSNGESLIKNQDLTTIDLLLLDLTMPQMDGFEVLEYIKSHPEFSALKIIVLTLHESQQLKEKALSMGADNYLLKDCDFVILKNAVYEAVKHNKIDS